ncbi:MAG: Gfo/Idh/MocA family oxidoreductase, partial [Chthoniobacteraceae bacterium]
MAHQKSDGMNYAPVGKPSPVVKPGEFVFAAAALDHGHIYGQCQGLTEAGGECRYVFDPDAAKVEKFREKYPAAQPLRSMDEVLAQKDVQLVASAAVQRTGKKYAVYYSERLHVEASVRAGQLIEQGAIGRVVQVMGMGPHRSNPATRPAWFWSREKCGGILIDLGSHQFEQFLIYTGAKSARIVHAAVANYHHQQHPEFEDWGQANLIADNGATNYVRVDWLNPQGLRTWGDGRTFILGTEGYIEVRKYLNVGADQEGDHLFLVDHQGEHHFRCNGNVGFPY